MPSDDQGPYVVIAAMRIDLTVIAGATALPADALVSRILDLLQSSLSGCIGLQGHPVPGGLVLGLVLAEDNEGPLLTWTATVHAVLGAGLGVEVGVDPLDAFAFQAAAGEATARHGSRGLYAVLAGRDPGTPRE